MVALLVVPLGIALVPILGDYAKLKLNGTFLGVWLAHTGFGLPLAVYLLYNYITSCPRDIFESAFLDGATHFTIFARLVMPLSVPALASFAIFQFLWVWNDYLVALIFLGGMRPRSHDALAAHRRLARPRLAPGHRRRLRLDDPAVDCLLRLQRYFVRGLMAGSVKG